MKNFHIITLFLLANLSYGLCAMDINSPDFEFPTVAEATEPVQPKDIMKFAEPMPHDLEAKIDDLVDAKWDLFYNLLGADKMPYAQIREEINRDEAILRKFNVTPAPSYSNYVIMLPELSGYVLRFVRPIIRAINAAGLAGKEHELNTAQAEPNPIKRTQDLLALFRSLDQLNICRPDLHLFETYQMASFILTADRIKVARAAYNLDKIVEAKTYAYLLNPAQPPHDRNCFMVQEFIKGFPITDANHLKKIAANPRLKEKFKETLKQLYVLIEAAKLWNIRDIIITEDATATHIKASPTNLEKRDRYVKNYFTQAESVNVITDAFRNIAPLLKAVPEFFETWQNILMRDTEMVKIMKTKPDLVQLYPRLKE